MSHEHVDVLIVGAGLSGIGAAHHLLTAFPQRTYAILEARGTTGGTWDLFRYPGIRSDSDMHTLGYRFRPWTADKAIADGPAILEYVRDTAREAGIDEHIRLGHRVLRASWSTPDARWTVEAEHDGEPVTLTCGFLHVCSGYYRYDAGFTPAFPGAERFAGRLIHPQHWPDDLDCTGKRVVVIGSGATAVTLVPALAGVAEHVTMLQRSPSYIMNLPDEDAIGNALKRVLPAKVAYAITRWKNVAFQTATYQLSRRRPKLVKRLIRGLIARQLPAGFDVDTHFAPRYDPWDQRMCLVPNGDLFAVLRRGTASIVTDHIDTFTETGIRLCSGAELPADVVVSATGLNLLALGGLELRVDGRAIAIPEQLAYKGMMLEGVPNLAFTVGYTNASWTLKADLTSEFVCRLLAHMDAQGARQCVPVNDDAGMALRPFLDFQAGYVLRALDSFPKQGDRSPWQLRQNYSHDLVTLRFGRIDDGTMRFSSPTREPALTD
jgi:monooxygenase